MQLFNFCPHCQTMFQGPKCPICGCAALTEEPEERKEYRMSKVGRCQFCGGHLVDITVSCKKIICEQCGKEDK